MPQQPLSETERLDWLQLIRTHGIGPITFFRLLNKFGSAGEALSQLPEFSRASGRKTPIVLANRKDCEAEIKRAWQTGTQIIAACEPEYPSLLRAIADPPPLLFLQGHVSLFDKPCIAIIGARNASGLGRKFARQLALDLGQAGFVIVSGLARGIDGAAHTAGLETGTIAVVAGGIDYIYPPEHSELTAEIAKRGVLLSERALGAEPTARDFPRRNRLISGLSRGVVIVEAAARSGTLITARYALEQGREVFAVPGSPMDPRCHGANSLLRDGATLVESAKDVIETLANQTRGAREGGSDNGDLFEGSGFSDNTATNAPSADSNDIDPEWRAELRTQIFEFLGYSPIHRDEILRECDAPAGIIADILLELVLTGDIEEVSGGAFVRSE